MKFVVLPEIDTKSHITMKSQLPKILFAALLILFVSAVNAQGFKFGAKAGWNSASIGYSGSTSYDESKSVSSFHVGGFGLFKLAIVSIQLDAVYSGQGSKFVILGEEFKQELNYLNFPLVAKLHLGPINLQGGLQYGILLSAKFDGTDNKSEFNSADFGIPLGIGFDISKLMLEARYVIGVANISSQDIVTLSNNVLMISAGVKF